MKIQYIYKSCFKYWNSSSIFMVSIPQPNTYIGLIQQHTFIQITWTWNLLSKTLYLKRVYWRCTTGRIGCIFPVVHSTRVHFTISKRMSEINYLLYNITVQCNHNKHKKIFITILLVCLSVVCQIMCNGFKRSKQSHYSTVRSL